MLSQSKTKRAIDRNQRVFHQKSAFSKNWCKSYNSRTPRISMILVSILLGIALGLLLVADLQAMPPHPDLIERIEKGQQPMPVCLKNRAELLEKGIDTPGDLLTKHIDGLAKANISGTINILAILVDFSDQVTQVAPVFFDTLIYVDVSGSVVNYYKEVSYNTLVITTVNLPSTLGWQRASQTLLYYADGEYGLGSYPENAQKLVEEAVDAVDPYVDFSQYDNDLDGYVDGLIVVHAGQGAEYTGDVNDIWSHKWGITPRFRDGVYIFTYSMEPEYWITPGDMTCGVYCHELGHVFGLPDLYDTDYSSEGIGDWSLMASGSWNGTLGDSPAHLDAWSKIQLGFVTPNVLNVDQAGASIPAVENNQIIYKLWTNGSPASEYFLVANRQQIGYDTYIPGNGLLIWHIDDSRSNNDSEWWPGCGWGAHYKVALVQADDQWHLEHSINYGDVGDTYPGTTDNRTFNGASSPNSDSYAGAATNVSVTNISNSGTNMTADLGVGVPQDIDEEKHIIPSVAALHQNFPNPFNSRTDIRFQLSQLAFVQVDMLDINGRLVKKLFAGKLEPGAHKITWQGINHDGERVSSGVYFYRLSVDHKNIYRKMLYLK